MSTIRLRPLVAVATLAAMLTGCVVYDPGPGYYAPAPAYAPGYAYAPPVYGGVVIGGGGWYGHRHYWR